MKENKESSKDYRSNLDKKAEKGDPKAQKQKKRNRYNSDKSAAKNFILKKMKQNDVSDFRDYIAERVKLLREEKSKKSKKSSLHVTSNMLI